MSAHTPGPWKRFKSPHWAARMYIKDANGAHVAITHERNGELNRPDAEADANANLITAAPELWAACKAIVAGWGHQDGVSLAVELARAARSGGRIP